MNIHWSALALTVLCVTPATVRAETVLIYDDNLPGGQSDLEEACNLTGDYTCTRATGEGEFATEAGTGNYDILMVDLQNSWFVSQGAEDAVLDHVAAGGYAVLHLIDLENHASTADALGAVVTGTHVPSQDVYGGGELFNNEPDGGYSVPNPLLGGTNLGGADQELDAAASDPTATARFHYENVIQGPPALVTSHGETVVLIGFSPDETGQVDVDGDGVRDVREFLSNCLDYTLSCSDVDGDGDGYTPCDGDCDDDDDDVHPDALETPGDGVDSNCDGSDGEDADGDGHGSPESGGDDCDDGDADVYPGAEELANHQDDDCDGDIDEDTELADDDGDGYCEGTECSDGSTPGDCDDDDDDVHPDATESCYDGVDNNCDGLTDGEDEVACPEVGDDDDDSSPPSGGHQTVGGCECHAAAGALPALAPLALLGLWGLIRRR